MFSIARKNPCHFFFVLNPESLYFSTFDLIYTFSMFVWGILKGFCMNHCFVFLM